MERLSSTAREGGERVIALPVTGSHVLFDIQLAVGTIELAPSAGGAT